MKHPGYVTVPTESVLESAGINHGIQLGKALFAQLLRVLTTKLQTCKADECA